MTVQECRLGPLDAVIVNPQATDLTVVLCHGYGAPATDLVGLAKPLLNHFPEWKSKVRFVFPGAPLSLAEYGFAAGRAWWPLNVAALQQALMADSKLAVCSVTPPGLDDARAALLELLAALDIPLSQIVLGGFSQGAMLATDVALHLPSELAGLTIWSGMLVSEPVWRGLAPAHAGVPVFQSHGRFDPILPIEAAQQLHSLLQDGGMQVMYQEFSGDHTIPLEVLAEWGRFVSKLIPASAG